MKKQTNKKLLNQTQYAERRGVSRQYISKLVKQGVIALVDGKLLDPAAADKRLAAVANPVKTAAKRAAGGEGPRAGENLADDLLRARVKREREQGRLAELQRQKLEGELVLAADVDAAQFARAAAERDALLNWPARCGADMAAEFGLEARLVMTTLDKFVRQHLEERGQAPMPAEDSHAS